MVRILRSLQTLMHYFRGQPDTLIRHPQQLSYPPDLLEAHVLFGERGIGCGIPQDLLMGFGSFDSERTVVHGRPDDLTRAGTASTVRPRPLTGMNRKGHAPCGQPLQRDAPLKTGPDDLSASEKQDGQEVSCGVVFLMNPSILGFVVDSAIQYTIASTPLPK